MHLFLVVLGDDGGAGLRCLAKFTCMLSFHKIEIAQLIFSALSLGMDGSDMAQFVHAWDSPWKEYIFAGPRHHK